MHSNARKDLPFMIVLGFRFVRGVRFSEVKEGSPSLCIATGGGCSASKGSQHFNCAEFQC